MTAKRQTALRIDADVLALIDQRARKLSMSRTEYMIRAALGTLDEPPANATEKRFEAIERRLDRLENAASGDQDG